MDFLNSSTASWGRFSCRWVRPAMKCASPSLGAWAVAGAAAAIASTARTKAFGARLDCFIGNPLVRRLVRGDGILLAGHDRSTAGLGRGQLARGRRALDGRHAARVE